MTLKQLLEQATPLPWKLTETEMIGGDDKTAASCFVPPGRGDAPTADQQYDNAALIVHAVNLLPKLVAALEDARAFILRFDEPDEGEIATSRAISDVLDEANKIK